MTLVQTLNLFALMASISPVSVDIGSDLTYASEEAAATAASNLYNPQSIQEDREFIGAIFRTDEGFRFSVTAGRRGEDSIEFRLSKDDFDDVVALWHTHGGADPSHRYFSKVDTRTVAKFGMPLYLADYTGYLKRFSPGDKTIPMYAAVRLGLPKMRGFALGEYVKDTAGRRVRIDTKPSARFS